MPVSFDFMFKLWKMAPDYDILQFHVPFPLGDLACFLSRYKGKVSLWWHNDINNKRRLSFFVKPMMRWLLKRADCIIVSDPSIIESSDYLPPFRDKCRTIPLGLKFSDYETIPFKNYLTARLKNPRSTKLLFVGRIVHFKGVHVLIDAMRYVKNAELFIIGSGILESGMKRLVAEFGLSDRITFLGNFGPERFDELKSAFADCDMLVFPSVSKLDTFGLVQIEAMFYGKPVINTFLPTGVPHVSIHGETGLTVPVGDTDALVSAIQTLVDDADLRARFGENARKRVHEEYTFDRMLDRVYALYEELAWGGVSRDSAKPYVA
jgi:rhamnosyl/mannosyltransferase